MKVEDTGTGPAVLALHGLGGGAYFFRGLAERLQPEYRVVSVDLPATPSDFSMDTWVADLGAHVIIDRPAQHPAGIVVADRAQVHVALTRSSDA